MWSYQNRTIRKPEGIENKRAYLIGGGIASLAAAAFLIRDASMQGSKITIFEESTLLGGAMDGAGNAADGYIIRGGREMEEHYECCWNLFGSIPSLGDKTKTVLDEIYEINRIDPNVSACRVLHKCGKKVLGHELGLSDVHIMELGMLLLAKEEELENISVEHYFDPSFFTTPMWLYWRSMFAFQTWHSVIEMKRYMERFIHLLPGMSKLEKILFSTYNQYDSMILPLKNYLEEQGVVFAYNTQVRDVRIENEEGVKTARELLLTRNEEEQSISIGAEDLLFITNGSMTQNATLGDMQHPAKIEKNLGSSWRLWKNIAKQDPSFGNPDIFCGAIDKTKWISFTITCTDSPLAQILEQLTGRDPYFGKAVTGGIVTVKDSSWLLSVTCNRQPHFIAQPKNVLVLWAYGLFADKVGDFVKKKMSECSGEELACELLYHLGAKERIEEILPTLNVIPCMMPYITSQFMPRAKGDRPKVIPDGSTNFAFIGQFCEIEGECVFTVEHSVRSAISAVYGVLKIDKAIPPIYPSRYDVRVLAEATKTLYEGHSFGFESFMRKFFEDKR
ncbi:MAG: oleate hydratase [Sulfurimonadaceae bacterium]